MSTQGTANAGLADLAEAARMERNFPGWHVWLSSLGRWWAVRMGPGASYGRGDHWPMTLDADDAEGLRDLLEEVEQNSANRHRGLAASSATCTTDGRAR